MIAETCSGGYLLVYQKHTTGETVLGLAAKTIPGDLVTDLMDICMHHTKLPISDCLVTL
jgi:hypothetical protein